MQTHHSARFALPLLLAACAPLAEDADEADGAAPGDATQVVVSDEKADAAAQLKAHVNGFTVWIDPAVTVTARPPDALRSACACPTLPWQNRARQARSMTTRSSPDSTTGP